MNGFKLPNISSLASGTSNFLNIIKKCIPVYKEIKPLVLKKNIKTLNVVENKKESNSEYNDSLTFFH